MAENTIEYFAAGGMRYTPDRYPTACPICHHALHVVPLISAVRGDPSPAQPSLEIVFQCPRESCAHLFIARYKPTLRRGENDRHFGVFVLTEVVPQSPVPPDVPEEVSRLLPGFVGIYYQASAAESWRLDQVAGVGYRKALEFLIKDYCSHLRPDDAAQIKQVQLGTCINNYVDDARVKECAKRAAWLGNDETHYLRNWTDRDIGDLKTLIQLTVNWIYSTVLTQRYIDEMPRPGGTGRVGVRPGGSGSDLFSSLSGGSGSDLFSSLFPPSRWRSADPAGRGDDQREPGAGSIDWKARLLERKAGQVRY